MSNSDFDFNNTLISILKRYKNPNKWEGSLFGEIKLISNTHVGSVGQDFIEELCKGFLFNYSFPMDSQGNRLAQSPWDIMIEGITFELKTASEDINKCFQFNHIRYHRDYDAVLCLGIAPNNIYFDVWTKADIATNKAGRLVSMEKGANASYKLTKSYLELRDISTFKDVMGRFIQNSNI